MTSPDAARSPAESISCRACANPVLTGNDFCGACGTRVSSAPGLAGDQLLGQVIDSRFRVVKLLGSGGMGAVYLAEHVGIGKKVAVKVLRTDLRNRQADLVARFRREAMAVSRLTDAHTITVFDFGVWKGLVYLVMEYLRGEDLAEVLEREGHLDEVRALQVAHQLCSSLAEAHGLGIVHRDLKPENIFVTRTTSGDELVKVLDFGLAKMLSSSERTVGTFQTQDGALLGTPYFMSPEQVRAEAVDQRSDLYALGALMFRMLTGSNPYCGRSPLEVLDGHLAGRLPSFFDIDPALDVSSELETLVRRLMARSPAERPATALEVDQCILRLLDGSEHGSLIPRTVSRAPSSGGALPDPPVSFSTSGLQDSGELDALLEGDLVAGPTRDEFAAYERRLKLKAWVVRLGLVVMLGGGGYGAWQYVEGRPYEPPPQEVEPNDDPKDATRILPGRSITGFLGRRRSANRSDRDVFIVDVPAHRPYAEIALGGVPGIDLVVEGFDTDGQLLFKHNKAGEAAGENVRGARVDRPRLVVVVREVWVQGQRPQENSTDAYEMVVRFHADPP